jgi:hypothetical protein
MLTQDIGEILEQVGALFCTTQLRSRRGAVLPPATGRAVPDFPYAVDMVLTLPTCHSAAIQ